MNAPMPTSLQRQIALPTGALDLTIGRGADELDTLLGFAARANAKRGQHQQAHRPSAQPPGKRGTRRCARWRSGSSHGPSIARPASRARGRLRHGASWCCC